MVNRPQNTRSAETALIAVLAGLSAALTLTFVCMDFFTNTDSSCLKYAVVLACLTMSVCPRKKDALLTAALIITAISDFLLLFTTYFAVAVLVFSAAHVVYFYRNTDKLKAYVCHIPCAVTCLILYKYTRNLLVSAALWYAFCLAANAVSAFFTHRTLVKYGMILFVLCDICVLLFNASAVGADIGKLSEYALPFIWVFYAPSQLLLALSVFDGKGINREK